jgi:hypothetical protein
MCMFSADNRKALVCEPTADNKCMRFANATAMARHCDTSVSSQAADVGSDAERAVAGGGNLRIPGRFRFARHQESPFRLARLAVIFLFARLVARLRVKHISHGFDAKSRALHVRCVRTADGTVLELTSMTSSQNTQNTHSPATLTRPQAVGTRRVAVGADPCKAAIFARTHRLSATTSSCHSPENSTQSRLPQSVTTCSILDCGTPRSRAK